MNRNEVYEVILGLVEVNDWEIFAAMADQHPSEFPFSDRALHILIGSTLKELIDGYDYTASPQFHRDIAGKSEAFAEMKARLESAPVKRRDHLTAFINSLASLPKDDRAFELLERSRHGSLQAVRAAVLRLGG